MSQLPSPDEQWDEMWSQVKWYHIPLILIAIAFGMALYCISGLFHGKGK